MSLFRSFKNKAEEELGRFKDQVNIQIERGEKEIQKTNQKLNIEIEGIKEDINLLLNLKSKIREQMGRYDLPTVLRLEWREIETERNKILGMIAEKEHKNEQVFYGNVGGVAGVVKGDQNSYIQDLKSYNETLEMCQNLRKWLDEDYPDLPDADKQWALALAIERNSTFRERLEEAERLDPVKLDKN